MSNDDLYKNGTTLFPYEEKRGRPTKFSEEIAEEILDRLAAGEFLIEICKDEHLPSDRTVNRWVRDPNLADFCRSYARARQAPTDWRKKAC